MQVKVYSLEGFSGLCPDRSPDQLNSAWNVQRSSWGHISGNALTNCGSLHTQARTSVFVRQVCETPPLHMSGPQSSVTVERLVGWRKFRCSRACAHVYKSAPKVLQWQGCFFCFCCTPGACGLETFSCLNPPIFQAIKNGKFDRRVFLVVQVCSVYSRNKRISLAAPVLPEGIV